MKQTTIAVSGVPGSFSEEAGLLYAQRMDLEVDMVFGLDVDGVLKAVDSGEVELGIFPVVNSRGGLVHMAFEGMGKYNFTMIDELWFEVYQCLMTMPGVAREEITSVASHPQALAQCDRYLKKNFPEATLVEWEDTAKAAKDLANGTLPRETAVIAPVRSAHLYELELLEKGIQDAHPNLTTFIIVNK